jgi:hypothetical protein
MYIGALVCALAQQTASIKFPITLFFPFNRFVCGRQEWNASWDRLWGVMEKFPMNGINMYMYAQASTTKKLRSHFNTYMYVALNKIIVITCTHARSTAGFMRNIVTYHQNQWELCFQSVDMTTAHFIHVDMQSTYMYEETNRMHHTKLKT